MLWSVTFSKYFRLFYIKEHTVYHLFQCLFHRKLTIFAIHQLDSFRIEHVWFNDEVLGGYKWCRCVPYQLKLCGFFEQPICYWDEKQTCLPFYKWLQTQDFSEKASIQINPHAVLQSISDWGLSLKKNNDLIITIVPRNISKAVCTLPGKVCKCFHNVESPWYFASKSAFPISNCKHRAL